MLAMSVRTVIERGAKWTRAVAFALAGLADELDDSNREVVEPEDKAGEAA
jgi:hypothetical protein